MTDTSQTLSEDRFDIAGDWLLRLQAEEVAQDEFSAWLEWYEADPLNRAAFEEAQSVFEAARDLPSDERSQWAKQLLALPRQEPKTVPISTQWLAGLLSPFTLSTRQRRYAFPVAAAFAVALVVGVFEWQSLRVPSVPIQLTATFQTPLATHRIETLPDGSEVRLGARSSISVNFSGETRYLVLEGGEASFKVAKDPSRPFIVHAGQVSVRAVGTEFNVRRAADSTEVAVSEGVVDVVQELPNARSSNNRSANRIFDDHSAPQREVRLKAGEEVLIDERTAPSTRPVALAAKPVDRAAISAWRDGRLEFVNEPLRLVVATVNRYSPREIVVTDQSLSELSITGSVSEAHTEEWLRALPEIIPVRITEVGKETVLVSPLAAN
jgi:transmembrane sensor